MRIPLCLAIVLLLCMTLTEGGQPKCPSSSLYYLFEEYYTGHPYHNVNLDKGYDALYDMTDYHFKYGSIDKYRIRNKIGQGTFGSVFKAKYKPDGLKYALKKLVTREKSRIKREVKIMEDLAELPNILPLRNALKNRTEDGGKDIFLVFDYFKAQDAKVMFPTLSKYQVKYLVYQAFRTLDLAHSKGIVHRDIKPLNVLMNSDKMETRVIDWGHSDYFLPGLETSTSISTIHFKSPELLLEYRFHDYALDVWSAGCMLAEMTFLKLPFFKAEKYTPKSPKEASKHEKELNKIERSLQQLDAIARILGTLKIRQFADKFRDTLDISRLDGFPDYKPVSLTTFITPENSHLVDTQVVDLLEKLFIIDHTRRITAAEAMMHPYFDEVRDAIFSESSENIDLAPNPTPDPISDLIPDLTPDQDVIDLIMISDPTPTSPKDPVLSEFAISFLNKARK